MSNERQKKCFTPIHCDYHSHCELAHVDYNNGYFNPTNVGEHCHNYKRKKTDIDLHEQIALQMGAHE